VRVETLLPLGKLDPGLREPETPLDLGSVPRDAAFVEALGYDGLVVEETKDDPFSVLSLAGSTTTRIGLGTSVAIAFARSPTAMAMSAWSLQKLSKGRFTLGLGSQVKGHIERRFGMPWSAPAPRMRDYVGAVRAVWNCWQSGESLDYQGSHYKLSLMVPLFNPGPIEHPDIPIHLAAVNPLMCEVAGEVAEGMRPHPVCTPRYIREIMGPALERGARKSGRDPGKIAVCMKPLIAAAPNAEILKERIRCVRARVAFYASTPSYRAVFELHGWGDLARELAVLSREQRWEEMPPRICDEMVETMAVVGLYDEIAERLRERYLGIASDVEFSVPVNDGGDALRGMLPILQA
jgi:probable F420-dependent oxidoreductase